MTSLNWAVGPNSGKASSISRNQQKKHKVIWLPIKDVFSKVERGFKLDIDDPKGGANAKPERIERAKEHFLSGGYMDPPEVGYNDWFRSIVFTDGRHRLVAAYQLGAKKAPFVVDSDSKEDILELIGKDTVEEGIGVSEEELLKKFPDLKKTKDLIAVSSWLRAEDSDIAYKIAYEPITKFTKDKERLKSLSKFPKDLKRVKAIAGQLRKTGKLLPVFIEEDDPDMFIIEGRHRILAFWLTGQREIPVVYVNKKEELKEAPVGQKELMSVDMDQFLFGGEFEFGFVYGERSTARKVEDVIKRELSKLLGGIKFSSDTSSFTTKDVAKTSWRLTQDESIKIPGEKYSWGAEFVTPALEWEEFRTVVARTFRYISRKGFITNGTTGMHCSISFKDEDKNKDIDPLKLAVIAGTDYLKNLWPRIQYKLDNGDLSNDYVKSNTEEIKSIIREIISGYSGSQKISDVTASNLAKKVEEWLEDSYSNFLRHGNPKWREKHFIVNLGRLKEHGYVEFRAVGGEGYENRFQEAEMSFRRYALALRRSADPDEGRNEYLKKLYKIFTEALEGFEVYTYDEDLNQSKHKVDLKSIKNENARKLLENILPIISKNRKLRRIVMDMTFSFDHLGKGEGVYSLLNTLSREFDNVKGSANTLRRFFVLLLKIYGVSRKDIKRVFDKHYWEPGSTEKLDPPLTPDGEIDDEAEDFDWDEYERQEYKRDYPYSLNDLYKILNL